MVSCTVFSFLSSFATLSSMNRELVALLYCLNDDAVITSNTDISVMDYKKLGFFAMC